MITSKMLKSNYENAVKAYKEKKSRYDQILSEYPDGLHSAYLPPHIKDEISSIQADISYCLGGIDFFNCIMDNEKFM